MRPTNFLDFYVYAFCYSLAGTLYSNRILFWMHQSLLTIFIHLTFAFWFIYIFIRRKAEEHWYRECLWTAHCCFGLSVSSSSWQIYWVSQGRNALRLCFYYLCVLPNLPSCGRAKMITRLSTWTNGRASLDFAMRWFLFSHVFVYSNKSLFMVYLSRSVLTICLFTFHR